MNGRNSRSSCVTKTRSPIRRSYRHGTGLPAPFKGSRYATGGGDRSGYGTTLDLASLCTGGSSSVDLSGAGVVLRHPPYLPQPSAGRWFEQDKAGVFIAARV